MRKMKKIWLVCSLFNLFLFKVKAQVLERYVIIMDEVLADPNPVVGLPNYEFIELKNNSAVAWDLFHWKISDGSSTSSIPIHYFLQPDSFVVICPSAAVNAFSAFGTSIGVSNFPSLNNDEDVISLYSPEGKLIHAMAYKLNWYNNAIKSEGGWTAGNDRYEESLHGWF